MILETLFTLGEPSAIARAQIEAAREADRWKTAIGKGICPDCDGELSFGSRAARSSGPIAPDACTNCGWLSTEEK